MEIELRPLWVPLVPTPYGVNALCLELCNAFPDQALGFEGLVQWSVGAGATSPKDAKALLSRSKRDAAITAEAFGRASRVRDAIFRVFSAQAAQSVPDSGNLKTIESGLSAAFEHFRFEPSGTPCLWRWDDCGEDLESPLWSCLLSAAELLTSPLASRVRQCDGEDCEWLFLDLSHGRTRRWCDMQTCGNRAKARRYHSKKTSAPKATDA